MNTRRNDVNWDEFWVWKPNSRKMWIDLMWVEFGVDLCGLLNEFFFHIISHHAKLNIHVHALFECNNDFIVTNENEKINKSRNTWIKSKWKIF